MDNKFASGRCAYRITERPIRGFTLIELLVVIGIIAILVALLFPAISSISARKATVTCINIQKEIGIGLRLFATENNGNLPQYGLSDGEQNVGGLEDFWGGQIAPYLQLQPVKTKNIGTLAPLVGWNIMTCPLTTELGSSIGCNYGEVFTYGKHKYQTGSMKLMNIPGSVVLTADTNYKAGTVGFYSPKVWPLSVDRDKDGVKDSSGSFSVDFNAINPCHDGSFVAGLANGSVQLIKIRDWAQRPEMWGPP